MDITKNRAIKALSFDQNWVGWRYEQRNGSKPTKPPISPRGGYAKCDDPSTWGSLEEALTAKEKMNLDGIGFMLTPSASVTAIDIDNCIVEGELSPLARDVIASVNSYSEISPSGAGVRILAIGSLPDGGRKNTELGIEVYDQSRYVTVTGNHLPGTPADIEDRSEQLKQFHQKYFNKPTPANNGNKPTPVVNLDDQSIIDKASKAGNGAKFHALWSGDTSGYPSSSEADQALTNILAFWTKDQSQIDRLFRQSGLYRQKWDEKHQAGGATYGQMTIEKALAGVTDTYTPGHKDKTTPQVEMPSPTEEKKPPDYLPSLFPHLTLSQGLELPPSDYLVYGAIERDDLGMIYGDAAAGKTYLSIDLAVCLATGSPWMNRWQIKEPRKVLYFISEGRKAFFRRILAAVNGMGLRGYDVKKVYQLVDENFIIVPEVPQFFQNNAERHFTHYLDLWQEMESPQVDIFFIDTIRRASVGGNENAQQDVSIVIDGINRMQQKMGSAACFIHHSNKSGGYSGSTVYRGNIDFQFRVEGVYREPRKLTIDKIRDGELDGPIPGNDHVAIFKPDEVSGGTFTTWPEVETLNLNEDTKAAAKAKTEILYILEEAKMPLNQSEIVKRSSVGRYNTLTALKELEYENKILAETRGRSNVYQITKRGEF